MGTQNGSAACALLIIVPLYLCGLYFLPMFIGLWSLLMILVGMCIIPPLFMVAGEGAGCGMCCIVLGMGLGWLSSAATLYLYCSAYAMEASDIEYGVSVSDVPYHTPVEAFYFSDGYAVSEWESSYSWTTTDNDNRKTYHTAALIPVIPDRICMDPDLAHSDWASDCAVPFVLIQQETSALIEDGCPTFADRSELCAFRLSSLISEAAVGQLSELGFATCLEMLEAHGHGGMEAEGACKNVLVAGDVVAVAEQQRTMAESAHFTSCCFYGISLGVVVLLSLASGDFTRMIE